MFARKENRCNLTWLELSEMIWMILEKKNFMSLDIHFRSLKGITYRLIRKYFTKQSNMNGITIKKYRYNMIFVCWHDYVISYMRCSLFSQISSYAKIWSNGYFSKIVAKIQVFYLMNLISNWIPNQIYNM